MKSCARPMQVPLSMRPCLSGFSLVEMMVAITISLLILLAMTSLLANVNRVNSELQKTNSRIENGRFAVQLLQGEVAEAGYLGGLLPQFDDLSWSATPNDVPVAAPAACAAFSDWTLDQIKAVLAVPVQMFDAVPPGCDAIVTDKVQDSDVLVVRRAQGCIAGETGCEADTAGHLYLQVSDCATEIKAVPARRYGLGTETANLHRRDCLTAAGKRRFLSQVYYVRDHANAAGDGIPTLVRSELHVSSSGQIAQLPAVPLIEGIQSLKLELGIDSLSDTGSAIDYSQAIAWDDPKTQISPTNRGDGVTDGAFIRCTTTAPCTVQQLMNVVAVKMHILARSSAPTPGYTNAKTYQLGESAVGPFNDNFLRHVFSSAARLTNVAGRRETP